MSRACVVPLRLHPITLPHPTTKTKIHRYTGWRPCRSHRYQLSSISLQRRGIPPLSTDITGRSESRRRTKARRKGRQVRRGTAEGRQCWGSSCLCCACCRRWAAGGGSTGIGEVLVLAVVKCVGRSLLNALGRRRQRGGGSSGSKVCLDGV
ncbi:hypothetical protein C8R45DRAFT_158609 [Mycena sanguinolenta]|nr:hypothetical protein C8R45DRAFT_158609 [Mycena sanguinolenta]